MSDKIGDNPEITQTIINGYPDRLRPEPETETEFVEDYDHDDKM